MVTMLLLFVVLSAVFSLMQSSLRAMKSQQGREISEVTFVQELLRRDLADALSVKTGGSLLELSRSDSTVPWQELLTMKKAPASIPPIEVQYQLVDGHLLRTSGVSSSTDSLIALESFESKKQYSDIQVNVSLVSGQRTRHFVWNFWCRSL